MISVQSNSLCSLLRTTTDHRHQYVQTEQTTPTPLGLSKKESKRKLSKVRRATTMQTLLADMNYGKLHLSVKLRFPQSSHRLPPLAELGNTRISFP